VAHFSEQRIEIGVNVDSVDTEYLKVRDISLHSAAETAVTAVVADCESYRGTSFPGAGKVECGLSSSVVPGEAVDTVRFVCDIAMCPAAWPNNSASFPRKAAQMMIGRMKNIQDKKAELENALAAFRNA